MAKIGTAHIEIKPVLNEEALDAIVKRIEDAVAEGISRGLNDGSAPRRVCGSLNPNPSGPYRCTKPRGHERADADGKADPRHGYAGVFWDSQS